MGYIILFVLYIIIMTGILLYCLLQLNLAYYYLKSKRRNDNKNWIRPKQETLPNVTIQLPIFNEMYVVERLIDAVCAMDYPVGKLEIQVLDDSTDETVHIAAAKVEAWLAKGIDIKHIRRAHRSGYKAGALQEGMLKATGEFIAIFDADFIPDPQFLQKTMPCFEDEKVGVVQTRWEHLNKNYSILTRVQAFALDVHFTVEQKGRNSAGCFINFNGTAGIWRKASIIDAGGWSADTLTEDLDLSFRAQLKGWKFKYLEEVGSPAELPAEIQGLKTQQYRWNKGGAETARKMIPQILKSKDISGKVKLHAFSHLMNSSVYVLVLGVVFLSFPMLFLFKHYEGIYNFQFLSFYFLATIAIALVFFVSLYSSGGGRKGTVAYYFAIFPLFLSINMGISLHNAIAVISGYSGVKSPFHRTPKFNIKEKKGSWKKKNYIKSHLDWVTITEGIFVLYFIAAMVTDIIFGNVGMISVHFLAALGFGIIFYFSIRQYLFTTARKD